MKYWTEEQYTTVHIVLHRLCARSLYCKLYRWTDVSPLVSPLIWSSAMSHNFCSVTLSTHLLPYKSFYVYYAHCTFLHT